ncbi:MAG: MarR family transcriptional regulator [Thermoplasmata archaeon]|nr:MarR family transcriptional regulator [Thermoplasmata archaeon]
MTSPSREFVSALEGLSECFQQEQRGLFRELKITPVQFFVLRWLAKDPAANLTKLAGFLGVRPQTVTPIVDALEDSGWVRRVRSVEDRRESHLQLTPKGKRLIASFRVAFYERMDRAVADAPGPALRTSAHVLRVATATLLRDLERARTPSSRRT